MERTIRTLEVDSHHVAVVETVEEEGSLYLIYLDGAIVNSEAPLTDVPSDDQIRGYLARRTGPR